jgi:hypothetical protein
LYFSVLHRIKQPALDAKVDKIKDILIEKLGIFDRKKESILKKLTQQSLPAIEKGKCC